MSDGGGDGRKPPASAIVNLAGGAIRPAEVGSLLMGVTEEELQRRCAAAGHRLHFIIVLVDGASARRLSECAGGAPITFLHPSSFVLAVPLRAVPPLLRLPGVAWVDLFRPEWKEKAFRIALHRESGPARVALTVAPCLPGDDQSAHLRSVKHHVERALAPIRGCAVSVHGSALHVAVPAGAAGRHLRTLLASVPEVLHAETVETVRPM